MEKMFKILIGGCVGVSVVSASVYVFASTSQTSVFIGKREQPQIINAARAGDWARIVSMQLAYEEFLRQQQEANSTVDQGIGVISTSTEQVSVTSTPVTSTPIVIPPVIVERPVEKPEEIIAVTPQPSKKKFTYIRVLKYGMRGDDVAELQRALQIKKIPLIVPRGQEGIFGPRTMTAVKLFQKQNRLRQTGIVDKMFAEVINR